jgi:uncharacterized phage protein (TIGR01671 family)
MRILKFRVWDGKAMAYPKTVEIGINGVNGLTSASYQLARGGYCTSAYVMQFTGLLDKQGKEIYEGDILGGIWASGWIAWCEKCKSFEYFIDGFGCASCERDIYWQEVIEDEKRLEVIGNIYENTELLEVAL